MEDSLRVLLIEDVDADAELILRALRKTHGSFEHRVTAAAETVVRELRAFKPQVVLTDHVLPGFSGYSALEIVLREAPGTPVIVVTGSLDEESAADYIKAGATDFVVKDNLRRLGSAVTRALELASAHEQRQHAEEARTHAEQRFRALVEHGTDVITLLEEDGTIRYSSQSLAGALGYAPGERVGRNVFTLIHPDHASRAKALFSELRGAPGTVMRAEVLAKHQNGSWRNVELVASNRLDDPAVTAVVVNWRDITERRQVQKQLADEQERQRAFFAASPLPMWIYDRGTLQVVDVNERAIQHYGYSREEFLQRTIRELRPEDELERFDAVIAIDRPSTFNAGIWKHRKKDGSIIDVDVHTTDLNIEGRRLRLAALSDVTEQRRLAAEMEETQRLEAIGRLAGGVSHDFNNLLTVIEASTEFLLADLPPQGGTRNDVELIRSAAREAAALTRQLLAFSRRQVLEPSVLNLNALIPETHKMLSRLLGARVKVQAKLAPDLGRVKLDPGHVQQILVNLAVNARDAMPNGGTITIETENVTGGARGDAEAPDNLVVLRVSDTGVGMDAATRARVFEPFFTTKERGKGTGLGLATVYGIVQQSGGQISVRSAVGEGASFEISLPRVWDAPDAGRAKRISLETPRASESVLIAEDDVIVRGLLVRILRGQGYRVLEAANAADAIKIAAGEKEPIDLLLSDVVMPGMSGPGLAQTLRKMRPALRVLFVSGYVEDDVLRDTAMLSGDALLQKPFGNDDLKRAVRKALDAQRS